MVVVTNKKYFKNNLFAILLIMIVLSVQTHEVFNFKENINKEQTIVNDNLNSKDNNTSKKNEMRYFPNENNVKGNLRKNKNTSEPHKDLREIIRLIGETVKNDLAFKGQAFEKTAYIVDTFGPRMWGQESLEAAIQEMYGIMKSDGFENVRLEKIDNVPVWRRGNEYLLLRDPRPVPVKIPMIGLGISVGGDLKNVEVVVVKTLEELDKVDVKGKIVLINGKWEKGYFNTVSYRTTGPTKAAAKGAVGAIIRSIAPKSLENPHTGKTNYDEKYPKIPACAISLEDADMLQRMQDRGQKIVVDLYMEAKMEEKTSTTYNLVGEFQGSTNKDEIVLLGGHIDSWDTGSQTGANDDLGGFYVCYEAVRLLIKLGLRPKRTLRVIGWSGEEQGFPNKGAFEYAIQHKDELDKHTVAFESDEGVTPIRGFGLNSSNKAFSIVKDLTWILKDEAIFENDSIYQGRGTAVDTTPLYNAGVPQMVNLIDDPKSNNYNDRYFFYHHSAADTMNILDKDAMDSNVIGIAQLFYSIADLPNMLPRTDG